MSLLSSALVQINAFNTAPFTRSLTATLLWNPSVSTTYVQVTGNIPISWNSSADFGVFTTLLTGNNKSYTSTLTGLASSLNPIVVNFTTPTYYPQISSYSLYNVSLSGSIFNFSTSTSITAVTADSFPILNNTLFVNYENTNNSNSFYRTLCATYPVKLSCIVDGVSTTSLSSNYYNINLSVNSTRLTAFSSVSSFNATFPTVCSVSMTVSAISAINSLSSFWTAHTYPFSMSAIFISSFPQANFIVYPTIVFNNGSVQTILSGGAQSQSNGVYFYGEGHTETINLSAKNINDSTARYIWSLAGLSAKNTLLSSTNTIDVTSKIGSYPVYPISLFVSNSAVLSSAPTKYYDDRSGALLFYPYYSSTIDVSGNPLSGSTLNQSLSVIPYEGTVYSFNAGTNGNTNIFQALNVTSNYSAKLSVAGGGQSQTINPYYDKYGIVWVWKTFNSYGSAITLNPHPSSWGTVALSGAFPKKWRLEGALSAVATSPVQCINSATTWSLVSPDWSSTTIAGAVYPYNLELIQPYNGNIFTIDNIPLTTVTLQAQVSTTCSISAAPYDWQNKSTVTTASSSLNIFGAPGIKIFTPNYVVLTGSSIKFQNLTNNFSNLQNLTVYFDDTNSINLLSVSDFYYTYNTPGYKSLILSGVEINGNNVVSKKIDNIVYVVSSYDDVDESKFITKTTPLLMPYTDPIKVASNDSVVDDNINSVIQKFCANLDYLNERRMMYDSSPSISVGWLGNVSTFNTSNSSQLIKTWNDMDCTINPGSAPNWNKLAC